MQLQLDPDDKECLLVQRHLVSVSCEKGPKYTVNPWLDLIECRRGDCRVRIE